MSRYIWQGDFIKLPRQTCDVVIVGTGLAGIYTALHLDPSLNVIMISKTDLSESNSMHAQGGIAAAVGPGDTPSQHYQDSWEAGSGLGNPETLQVLVHEGPENIRLLQAWGVPFDLDSQGFLITSREGAHRRDRIVHCHGDATGYHVTSLLALRLEGLPNCTIIQNTALVDFLSDQDDNIIGVLTMNTDHPDDFGMILARHVVLATGGIGGLFPRTTNAATVTGDGLAAAMRCGAIVKDLEFIQFHPTALPKPDTQGRCFLISEALRGEGAILRDHAGRAFMSKIHPMADLAPRDVVSRAIFCQMQHDGTDHVWLDITHKDREFLRHRFPMIYETCSRLGLDMASQWLPVAPVQHYFMGGVATDVDGRTSRQGLWACGEASCTGIYGANRLASNSLLECLVFGRRIARTINALGIGGNQANYPPVAVIDPPHEYTGPELPESRIQTIRQQIGQMMDRYCGIMRNHDGLKIAWGQLVLLSKEIDGMPIHNRLALETCQMVASSKAIVQAAMKRKESVGAHYRTDAPGSGMCDQI